MQAVVSRPEELFPQTWFPVALAPIGTAVDDLHPEERALMSRAVASRVAAFAAGRRCARHALARLAVPGLRTDAPIVRDPHGCPRWPAPAVGSISHSPTTAVAVAARRADARGVGIDIESVDHGIGLDTLSAVFVAAEVSWLDRQPAAQRTRLAYVLFSAREALYKCVYQAASHRLAPQEVEVTLHAERGLFHAAWRGAAAALGLPPLVGRFGHDARHVFAGVWCPPPAHPRIPLLEEISHGSAKA